MTTNTRIALIIYGLVNAVVFGTGAIIILSVASLQEHWPILLPVIVVVSLVVAWPIAQAIAPRLRSRYGRRGR
ncbi:hypothetical protein JYU29_12800 [Tianweitania sp. BSSL-BM11]|uniref:CTP synthetase n=1 Tax=Tianweitania aestuarii TaxID=2814886 RepID=A0ABS5RZ24_9HYPH|nr:hypothetical protein [Tianweitania aestuarii]MBS9721562.1 hypothetical protein [Tianweitania aestuarii]